MELVVRKRICFASSTFPGHRRAQNTDTRFSRTCCSQRPRKEVRMLATDLEVGLRSSAEAASARAAR